MKTRTLSILTLAALSALQQFAQAGTTNDQVTISLSGSTAMRNFTTAGGFTLLTPGTSITLNSGPGGSAVVYTAPNGPTTAYQLAPGALGSSDPNDHYGLRVEWHEQGSVEGILELANSQIAPLAAGIPSFNGGGNRVFVNRNPFTGPNTIGGYVLDQFGQPQGQSAMQMAISDVNARQGFSRAGTGTFSATSSSSGYGQGNAALSSGGSGIGGLGGSKSRQQLQPETVLNLPSGTSGTGPWNNGGADNLENKVVAVTATVFAANPGTGLTKLNRSDAQWLQTTGRLANGADFNVAQRDVNSGTRNVAALNTGVDPSWAVGEHDSGDNSNANQSAIGANMKFSGKTAGGALSTTIRNARMGVGPLGMSDAIGQVRDGVVGSQSTTPLRALDYSDSAADGTFIRASVDSITDGSFVIWQNETYVTVKNPGAAFATDTSAQWRARTDAETGIKGDNAGNDVADVRGNILSSVANFPGSTSVANPADQLLATSFILPQMVWKKKDVDGVGTSINKSASVGTSASDYNPSLRTALIGSTYKANLNVGNPSLITKGAAGSAYNGASNAALGAGTIGITDNGSGGGNRLFGNFNQDGRRDFASVVMSAQDAQAKLSASGLGTNVNAGGSNASVVAGLSVALAGMNAGSGATKGDLIVMGDYNADGAFDGKDLFAMAHGAALADTNTGSHLTAASGATLGDQLRHGVLRKNAALDWLRDNATDQQKEEASFKLNSRYSFWKEDVNHDGLVTLKDARLVDYYAGQRYTDLNQQLAALQGGDLGSPTASTSTLRLPFNLVDAELNDSADGLIDATDFAIIRGKVGHGLAQSDVNIDGQTTAADFAQTDFFFGAQGNISDYASKWSTGDTNLDGFTDVADYTLIDASFVDSLSAEERSTLGTMNSTRHLASAIDIYDYHAGLFGEPYIDAYAALASSVPEPTMTAIALVGTPLIGSRRRRRA